jgi:negative regulator of sigma-B (phosphoserine phosphatase)
VIFHKKYPHTSLCILQEPKPGQFVCGDSFFTHEADDYFIMGIVDGLGSGKEASKAANKAVECFREHQSSEVSEIIQNCNQSLLHTRGGVAAIMKLDFAQSMVSFSGVGNIQFIMFPENQTGTLRAMALPGFLGGRPIKSKTYQYKYQSNTPFLMFSDGLQLKSSIQQKIRWMNAPQDHVEQILSEFPKAEDDITVIAGRTIL